MSTRRVVIDDADSRIQYSGSWFTAAGQDSLGDDGPTYLGSQHGLKGDGSFTFTFEGTSIELYGTNGQIPASGGYDPKWGCHVDGEAVSGRSGSSEATNNWPLCSRDGLSAGTHKLVVDVEGLGQGTFWFDRLMYTPSGSPPSESVLWVDATTDSAFQYDSTWHSSGVMVTAVHGGSVSFSFTGSGLAWVGEIPDQSDMSPASLTYTIDGGNAATVNMVAKASENSPTQRNHVLFSTPDIASGSHTLKVTYNGNSNTPLTAGYVYVRDQATRAVSSPPPTSDSDSSSGQASNSSNQSPSPSGVSSGSGSGSGSSSTSPSSPQNSNSASSSSSPSLNSHSFNSTSSPALVSGSTVSSQQATASGSLATPIGSNPATPPSQQPGSGAHSTNIWIIIVGVLGGIILILLLLFFFMRRRRRRQLLAKPATSAEGNLTPFTSDARTPPIYNDSMAKLIDNPSRSSLHSNGSEASLGLSQDPGAQAPLTTEIKRAAGPSGHIRDTILSLGAPPSYTQ
ncbi:hypothetical protein DXG01_003321 [Tephrocybe rancida]|nr:hypothetical protein DXG01_003321 [Tephrocybe rancida]